MISIIMPVLNEAGGIVDTLEALQGMRRRGHEIIVVDGGSTDNTWQLCAPLADRIIPAATGRARQMQAGAALARGSVLWFLHADTRAPQDADRAIGESLGCRQSPVGTFRRALPAKRPGAQAPLRP